MLQQQIIGIFNLSLPLIILYNFQPLFILTLPGQLSCSFLIGAYIWYLNYLQLKNLEKSLQYYPTGIHKEMFYALIQECNIDPADVILKYAFTNESIAMTACSTVIIDSMLFNDLQDDPQAAQVQEIFKIHVEPGLSQLQKERILAIHQLLTPGAQRFIFKHELGHVARNFSYKKLFIVFLIGFFAAYGGIAIANFVLSFHWFFAIVAGMIVGGVVDLFLTYLSNLTFKLYEENAADAFAVKYSSNEDIQDAAIFFKNHQDILDRYADRSNFLVYIPLTITTGYQNGYARSIYLLELMTKK